ncbi:MAG: CDP-alcohol phosphatidyltransferase family protein [Anaerolineales bacterium]
MQDVENHERVHRMLLGPLERPALRWLAANLPRWTTPDMMTIVGVLGSVLVFAGYCLTRSHKGFLWLANLGFLINWFGDSMDGTLARYRKIERPKYGFFVDHTVDSLCQVLVFVGLGLSYYVRLDIASLACIGYLLMSILAYVGAIVSGEFKISYGGIGPTEMRLIAVLANVLIFFLGNPLLRLGSLSLTVFDLMAAIVTIGLYIMFLASAFSQARKWSKLDPAKD